jgi:hypothetical protein
MALAWADRAAVRANRDTATMRSAFIKTSEVNEPRIIAQLH